MFRNVRVPLVATVGLALALAGCGSSSSTSTTAASSSSTSASASSQPLVPPPSETPPTTIPIKEPLTKTPPKGKTFMWMQCELPICELFRPGVEEATKALGWHFKSLVYSSTNPGGPLTQAIQQHPDYIGITGLPAAALKPQLAEAAKAGIPVISCSSPERPGPGGFAAICGTTLTRDAEYVGRWAINDSKGKAHILGINVPDYPILAEETEWFKKHLSALCSGCSYEELAVTAEEIGAGKVGSRVVGYLQTHPEINYLFYAFSNVQTGVPEALKAAGLDEKVKQLGDDGEAAQLKEIGTTQAAWAVQGHTMYGWTMVDAAARLAAGMTLTPQYQQEISIMPTWILASKEEVDKLSSTGYNWDGPTGFQKQFEELWKVG